MDEDDIFRMVEREMRRMMRIMERMFSGENVQGVKITVGPDGVPHVEEIRPQREPLTDVRVEGDEVIIVSHLPGARPRSVRVHVKGNNVVLSARGDEEYFKRLRLPFPVDPRRGRASFKNWILEVRLPRSERYVEGSVRVQGATK